MTPDLIALYSRPENGGPYPGVTKTQSDTFTIVTVIPDVSGWHKGFDLFRKGYEAGQKDERETDDTERMVDIAHSLVLELIAIDAGGGDTVTRLRSKRNRVIKVLRRVVKRAQAQLELVAYRHFMPDDGWEYFDAPTGQDCGDCLPLYAIRARSMPLPENPK